MSALLPKADIAGQRLDVRFVPTADIGTLAFLTWINVRKGIAAADQSLAFTAASTFFVRRS
jgi:hypothetical protein